jgi:hypothetical protein
MNHYKHNVLGLYCWTCQVKTSSQIPGWPKPSKNDGPKVEQKAVDYVRWQDGSINAYQEKYKEIITKQTYWNWVEENGGKEPLQANPDKIGETDENESYE